MSQAAIEDSLLSGKLTSGLLAQWSHRYRKALLNFFRRRISGQADHEDLVQEVFLRLARRKDLHDIQDIDRYIFRSASNVLTDWRRHGAAHAAGLHDDLSDELPDRGFDPERLLIGSDALGRLMTAVSTMPPRTQAVFTLYHFDHRSHAQIAGTLGIAVRTVEDHMARANARLTATMATEPLPRRRARPLTEGVSANPWVAGGAYV